MFKLFSKEKKELELLKEAELLSKDEAKMLCNTSFSFLVTSLPQIVQIAQQIAYIQEEKSIFFTDSKKDVKRRKDLDKELMDLVPDFKKTVQGLYDQVELQSYKMRELVDKEGLMQEALLKVYGIKIDNSQFEELKQSENIQNHVKTLRKLLNKEYTHILSILDTLKILNSLDPQKIDATHLKSLISSVKKLTKNSRLVFKDEQSAKKSIVDIATKEEKLAYMLNSLLLNYVLDGKSGPLQKKLEKVKYKL